MGDARREPLGLSAARSAAKFPDHSGLGRHSAVIFPVPRCLRLARCWATPAGQQRGIFHFTAAAHDDDNSPGWTGPWPTSPPSAWLGRCAGIFSLAAPAASRCRHRAAGPAGIRAPAPRSLFPNARSSSAQRVLFLQLLRLAAGLFRRATGRQLPPGADLPSAPPLPRPVGQRRQRLQSGEQDWRSEAAVSALAKVLADKKAKPDARNHAAMVLGGIATKSAGRRWEPTQSNSGRRLPSGTSARFPTNSATGSVQGRRLPANAANRVRGGLALLIERRWFLAAKRTRRGRCLSGFRPWGCGPCFLPPHPLLYPKFAARQQSRGGPCL